MLKMLKHNLINSSITSLLQISLTATFDALHQLFSCFTFKIIIVCVLFVSYRWTSFNSFRDLHITSLPCETRRIQPKIYSKC